MKHEDLVIASMPRAKTEALKYWRKTGGIGDRDDLVSVAYMALVDAAQRFDPSRGFVFWTAARPRVMGAMMDHLRGHSQLCGVRNVHVQMLDIDTIRTDPSATPGPLVDWRPLETAVRMLSPRSARIVLAYREKTSRGNGPDNSLARQLGYSDALYSWYSRIAFTHLRKVLKLRGIEKVSDVL